MNKHYRWLWGLVILLALTIFGCAGATTVSFNTVSSQNLPGALEGWNGIQPETPTVLASEQGGYLYLLISMGDCSPKGEGIFARKVSRNGPHSLWATVGFRKSLIKTTEPSAPSKTFIRIKLKDVEGIDTSAFTLQETVTMEPGYKPISLVAKKDDEAGGETRAYAAKEGYQCRVPIRW